LFSSAAVAKGRRRDEESANSEVVAANVNWLKRKKGRKGRGEEEIVRIERKDEAKSEPPYARASNQCTLIAYFVPS